MTAVVKLTDACTQTRGEVRANELTALSCQWVPDGCKLREVCIRHRQERSAVVVEVGARVLHLLFHWSVVFDRLADSFLFSVIHVLSVMRM